MMSYSQRLDTSNELAICRYGNGIKLLRPDQRIYSPNRNSTGISIADALKLPFNVFFLNSESVMQNINEVCASTMGFYSTQDSFGKTMFDISPAENAKKVIDTDITVVKSNTLRIAEDNIIHFDGTNQNFLTFKMPWYDNEDQIIGIFGCAILFGDQPLAASLMQISKFGLLNASKLATCAADYFQGTMINNTYLTKRENEILYQLVRGKTAKQIAEFLAMSSRTVEKHLVNIKIKLRVNSKAELIQEVIDYFI